MLENKNVLAIQCSDTQNEQYALFCDDKGLYHGNDKDRFVLLAVLENISLLDRPIKIYYHFPYICVSERYGLNAAVVNITNKSIIKLSREDYKCDVSSYSIGFLERDGRVLLIHQTQWNRLDITDLETEELLTEREIIHRQTNETVTDKWGKTVHKVEKKNYIDYFHSLFHISPDGKHFLSNGWVWQPSDNIICFETERFLKEYEPCGEKIDYYRGHSWDKPCAFVGNDIFVIAADNDVITIEDGISEAELKEPPAYHQLLFYKLSEIKSHKYTYSGYEGYDTFSLAYSGKADCDVFTFDEYGDISAGELHYKPETKSLIALSEKGAFELTLDGKIIHSNTDIKLNVSNWVMRFCGDRAIHYSEWLKNWQYDNIRDLFYRFNKGKIEKASL